MGVAVRLGFLILAASILSGCGPATVLLVGNPAALVDNVTSTDKTNKNERSELQDPSFRETKRLAELGDAEAQGKLGKIYEDLHNATKQEKEEMVSWYRRSATQGHPEGQFSLGRIYERGMGGVKRDKTQAAKWYRSAAEQGHARAAYLLGWKYEMGEGVIENRTEAIYWYQKSADAGDKVASARLSDLGVATANRPVVTAPREAKNASNRIAEMSILQLCRIGTQKKNGRFVETTGYGKNHLALALKRGVNCVSFMNKREALDSVSPTSVRKEVSSRSQQLTEPDGQICIFATVNGRWDGKNWAYVEEAKRRGLDCGVEKATQPVSQIDIIDSVEVQNLKDRLTQLEAEKATQQQSISQDTQNPVIRISNTTAVDAKGVISGIVADNTGVAEIRVDGEIVSIDGSGRFTANIFIPVEGKSVEVVAFDLKGLSTTETVRLERNRRKQTVSRLAAVNPLVGPKQKPSRDRAALIIGLEEYAEAPPADYASRDAQMFADYAREKLGISPENVMVLTDTEATRSGLLKALKVWLPQAVQPGTTDLYVFYAGHGMASDDGESAYIVPYGANTFLLEDTAISRERFYEEIGAAKPRTATFFFDNCYAGTTRSEERLLAQRPLSIKVQESPVPENYLVFTAGESNQTAGVLDEVKHGRFSYFVFKGLEGEADANSDGKISAGELHKYVRESVGRFSAGAQTPTMLGDAGRWVLR